MSDSDSDAGDGWWEHDGTVDWAVNPGGQIIELSFDGAEWVATAWTPYVPGRGPVSIHMTCGDQARRWFARLAVLQSPTLVAAMRRWLSEKAARRGRGNHPAGGLA